MKPSLSRAIIGSTLSIMMACAPGTKEEQHTVAQLQEGFQSDIRHTLDTAERIRQQVAHLERTYNLKIHWDPDRAALHQHFHANTQETYKPTVKHVTPAFLASQIQGAKPEQMPFLLQQLSIALERLSPTMFTTRSPIQMHFYLGSFEDPTNPNTELVTRGSFASQDGNHIFYKIYEEDFELLSVGEALHEIFHALDMGGEHKGTGEYQRWKAVSTPVNTDTFLESTLYPRCLIHHHPDNPNCTELYNTYPGYVQISALIPDTDFNLNHTEDKATLAQALLTLPHEGPQHIKWVMQRAFEDILVHTKVEMLTGCKLEFTEDKAESARFTRTLSPEEYAHLSTDHTGTPIAPTTALYFPQWSQGTMNHEYYNHLLQDQLPNHHYFLSRHNHPNHD